MEELIQAAAGGSQEAFRALLEAHQKQVFNLCLRMVGNPEDAADLSQEAFIRAWKGLPFFQQDCAFSTWLYRLTSNVCIDFLRSRKHRDAVSITFLDESEDACQWDLPDPAQGPEEQAIAGEDRESVISALNDLDAEYRQALTLRAVNGLSYSEISQVLDISEGTVKSRISRAREQIRRKVLQSGNISAEPSSKIRQRGRGK